MKDTYTTADLNAMLTEADAQQKRARRPMSNAMLGGIVPQVSAQDAAVNRPDPVERASLFPFATYPDGSTRLALPGMIAEDIPRAFTAPSRAYRGEIPDDEMISEGLNFAGNMAMTGGIAPKPYNAAGMFGGRLAKTADHAALARAEEMAAKGLPREDIWSQTGWFKGVDGKWRFEIDDSGAYSRYSKDPKKVGDAISHDELFAAYPNVENINFKPSLDGGLYHDGNLFLKPIMEGPTWDAGTLLHEAQHAVQSREGFPNGSSPSLEAFRQQYGTGPLAYARLLYDTVKTGNNVKVHGDAADAAFKAYKRNAGEVEARAVEARRHLFPEERRARPPWLDYDVPESQQIVRLGANTSEASAPGVVMAEAARQPTPIRAYHGSRSSWDGPFDPSRSSHSVPSTFFGTQADANYFASSLGNHPSGSSIRPVDIDATGMRSVDWPSISGGGADPHLYRGGPMEDLLRKEQANGSPGVVIKNIRTDEGLPVGDYVAMLENGRGRVRSATTGDILFENGQNASAPGALASEASRSIPPVQMEVPFYRGSAHGQTGVDYSQPYWGTTDKSLASDYAKSRSGMYFRDGTTPNVAPAVGRFRNPLYIDAQNAGWSDIPFEGQKWNSDKLADLAKERGHDGLVIDRLYDEGKFDEAMGLPATVAALRPGTVSSAFDPNNILYANSKSSGVPGALIAEAADKPRGSDDALIQILQRYGLTR